MIETAKIPDVNSQSVLQLLDAGEKSFSTHGFEGASMKAIAATAQVSQSLLHYHFGTKESLYRSVIERRAIAINTERLRLLGSVDISGEDAVARIFEALLGPPLGPVGGGLSYARIFAGMVAGGAREVELVRELYDDTARQFIDALLKASPDVTRIDATRAYSMAIGVLAIALPGDDRVARLAGTAPNDNRDALLPELVTYVCGGFEALTRNSIQN